MDNNKGNTNQNNNQQKTDDVRPVFMTEEPVPPSTDVANSSPATTPSGTGGAGPSDDIPQTPVVTTTSDGKGKSKSAGGKGKFIATILGITLLVGGLGAGVILVGQNQNIFEKAWIPRDADLNGSNIGDNAGARISRDDKGDTDIIIFDNTQPSPGTTVTQQRAEQQQECDNRGGTWRTNYNDCVYQSGGVLRLANEPCIAAETSPGVFTDNCADGLVCHCQGGDACDTAVCESEALTKDSCINQGRVWTTNYASGGLGMTCCVPGYVDNPNGNGCVPPEGGERPPGENPTGTPVITASCQDIRAFDTDWNQLTAAQLSQLSAGDKVRFAVRGIATTSDFSTTSKQIFGSFTKARFTINGSLRPEVTTQKPNTLEFYDEYTIPAGVTSFTVTAQVYHSSLGWK